MTIQQEQLSKLCPLYSTPGRNPRQVQESIVKALIFTGTYMYTLESNRFNKYNVSLPIPSNTEDREYLILHCSYLDSVQSKHLPNPLLSKSLLIGYRQALRLITPSRMTQPYSYRKVYEPCYLQQYDIMRASHIAPQIVQQNFT